VGFLIPNILRMIHKIYCSQSQTELSIIQLSIDGTKCQNTSIGIERKGKYLETYLDPAQLNDLIDVLIFVRDRKKAAK